MKKLIFILLSLSFVLGLTACDNMATSEKKEETPAVTEEIGEKTRLTVFAAASMTESLEKIGALYQEANPNVEVIYTFDSSGTLKTQIQAGAPADIFISAAQKQMDQLEEVGKLQDATRKNLLENKVTLVVGQNSNKEIKDITDLASDTVEKIALGNSDVPVGQYSEELLKNLGIWDKIQEKVTLGSNVKEVTTWVKEGAADTGIVYKTDAFSAGLKVVKEVDSAYLKTPVVYPLAIIKDSQNIETSQDFINFLAGPEAAAIFEEVGFTLVK